MKKLFLIVLCFLTNQLKLIGASKLEKDRAALIATRLVFPWKGKRLDESIFTLCSTEVLKQINVLKRCQICNTFFNIYLKQLESIESASRHDWPLHLCFMPEAKSQFSQKSAKFKQAIDNSPLFREFGSA